MVEIFFLFFQSYVAENFQLVFQVKLIEKFIENPRSQIQNLIS